MLTTGHILRSAIGIVAFLTSLAAQTPTKEYIRLGGRVVAIENPQATIIVTVSPPTVTLQSGQTAQFTASVSGSPNTAVDWSLEPQGSGSISAQGLYTAPHLSAPLAVTVKATSQADPSRFATAFATVYPPSNQSTLISFTYPSQVTAGQSFQATVVMRNSGETTWQSTAHNPTMPHRLGSTNPTDNVVWGLHRVEATTSPVPPGNDATFVINATAPSSSGVKTFDWQMVQDAVEWFGAVASGIITVNPSVPSCTVSINPSSATVYSGRRLHLSATTSNCGTASVSWSISDGPGTLSANGSIATYTAPTGVTEPLTARIRVAVAGHSAESDATIAIHPSQPPALGGVSPGTGSGTRQVFTFNAFDAQGHSDINNFQAVIFSDWGYTCHFFFNPEYDLIALQSDSGTWPSQPLGGAQNLTNSRCTIYPGSSSVIRNGDQLTLNVDLYFSAVFAGVKSIAAAVSDYAGNITGLQQLGTWAVPGTPGTSKSALVSFMHPAQVTPGQSFQATVVMRNTGPNIWQRYSLNPNQPHRLGSTNPTDNLIWGIGRVDATAPQVLPGEEGTFVLNVTAPTTLGARSFSWRMVHDAVEWFGALASGSITVTNNPYCESPHPYPPGYDQTCQYTHSGGPSQIMVTFDHQTNLAAGSSLHVTDGAGVPIAGSPFAGSSLAGQTKVIPGGTVRTRLAAGSQTAWGYRVTNVQPACVHPQAGFYDDFNPLIGYSGGWYHDTQFSEPRNQTISYSANYNASAEFSFCGSGITYWFTKAFNRGTAHIYIDNQWATTIDLYSPNIEWQQSLYLGGLAFGDHTIRIVVSGQKQPASLGTFVDLDGFTVH